MQRCVDVFWKMMQELSEMENGKPEQHPQILIVDDDDDIRLILQRIFERIGADVTVAAGGLAGMKTYDEKMKQPFWQHGKTKHPFDIVFLDLAMPVVNGVQVLRHIRQQWKFQPVAIVTGAVSAFDAYELQELKPVEIIQKPLSPDLITHVLGSRNLIDLTPEINKLIHTVG